MSKDISRRWFVSFVKFVFSKIIRPEWRPQSGETQMFFWHKNIRTYFLVSRRLFCFTQNARNTQNFTRSARFLLRSFRQKNKRIYSSRPLRLCVRNKSVLLFFCLKKICAFRAFCVSQNNLRVSAPSAWQKYVLLFLCLKNLRVSA